MKDLKIFNGVRFNDKRGFLKEVFIEKEIKQKLKFSIVSKSKGSEAEKRIASTCRSIFEALDGKAIRLFLFLFFID